MARIGLSSVINGSLIERLSALSTGDTTINQFQRPVLGDAVSVNVSSALRLGAQTFSTAIQTLNLSATVVVAAGETLKSLLDLTEKVLNVAEKASQQGLGRQSIQRYSLEFQSLGNKFQKIVNDAELDNTEILTTEGLTEFLTTAGIDPDSAASIADVFNRFILRPGEDILASETIDPSRPVHIPPGAYTGRLPAYEMSQVVNEPETIIARTSNVGGGYLTTEGYVYESIDAGFGTSQVFLQTNDGVTHNLSAPNESVNLLNANEATGYSLVSSNEDFMGHNASNFQQIFIADNTGTIIHQVTNNVSGTLSYEAADFSSDSKTVAWIENDGLGFTDTIARTTIGTFGTAPTPQINMASGLVEYDAIKVSDDGLGFAFSDEGGTNTLHFLYNGGAENATVAALTDIHHFGFIDGNQLAIARSASGDPTGYDWSVETIIDGGSLVVKQSNINIDAFATLEDAGGSTGYYAYNSTEALQFRLYNESNLVSSFTFQSGDLPTQLSLAYNSAGRVEIGAVGDFGSVSGDSSSQGYKFSNGTEFGNFRRSPFYDEVFDSARQITSRADAYRLISDLKGLKEQLEHNIKAVDSGVKTIQNNISFVRAAGIAFLDLSSQISSSEDADSVATALRAKIRQSTKAAAISEAHNLEPIIVAALTFQSQSDE